MGEGNVGIDEYVGKYLDLCPGRTLSLESIISPQPRLFPLHEAAFWDAYRAVPAWQFIRFLQIAGKGKSPTFRPLHAGETVAEREREDLESSLRYTKRLLATISPAREASAGCPMTA